MTGEQATSDTENDGIRYCPICGSEANPQFAFMSVGAHAAVIDCPQHGTIEVEYTEGSHRIDDSESGR